MEEKTGEEKISVTDSELRILELLWERGALTVREIQEGLEAETGWSKHTVISLLKRMMQKNTAAPLGRSPEEYVPLVSRESVVRQQSRGLAGRLFGGSAVRMLSALVAQEELSDAEIDSLMEQLRRAKEGKK